MLGPTAAKAIEDLTHKQAAQQKFGIGAVKQTSPAYEANLTNQQTVSNRFSFKYMLLSNWYGFLFVGSNF